jgi:uncharacterized protein YhaN
MRLRKLDLTRYGKFTDYSIDFGGHKAGTPDLHIVYGLNGAGKSTTLSAYLDLLFGIEERTRYAFLHQGKSMEIGGSLEFGGAVHELKRMKRRASSLTNASGQPVSDALLSVPLAGLTREAYQMMFSLDDDTLQQGGNAILESKGDLGELLFSASAGLAGVSATLADVDREADGIFRKRASSTRVAELKHRLSALKARRDEIDMQASAHAALVDTFTQAEAAYGAAVQETGAARSRFEDLSRLMRAHPLLIEHDRIVSQLQDYRNLPTPPDNWAVDVPGLVDEETRLQTRLAGLAQQGARLQSDLETITVDDRVLSLHDLLDQLADAAARYSTAEEDLPKRRAALAEHGQSVTRALARLGQPDTAGPSALLVPAATSGALRELIAAHSGVEVAHQSAAAEHRAAARMLDDARTEHPAAVGQVALDLAQIASITSAMSRLRDGALASDLRSAERALAEKSTAFADAVAPLHPWSGDGEALRRITLPDAARLEAWRAALASLEKRRAGHAERLRQLDLQLGQEAIRLSLLKASAGNISDVDSEAAFAARDEAWRAHRVALDRVTADAFEAKMRTMDDVSSARIASAKELAEIRTLSSVIASAEAEVSLQKRMMDDVNAELLEFDDEVRAEAVRVIGTAGDAPIASILGQLDIWRKSCGAAMLAWNGQRDAEQEIARLKLELETGRQLLASALAATGTEAGTLPVPALLELAEKLLSEQVAASTRQTEAGKRMHALERQLADRKDALDTATAALANWRQRWAEALSSTWFSDRQNSVGAVRELLEALSDLSVALRSHDDVQHRIDAMHQDQTAFTDKVAEIHALLGEAFDGADPLRASRTLAQRHADAQQTLIMRREREKALDDNARERTDVLAHIALHDVRKQEMLDLFAVDSLAGVRAGLAQCASRDRLSGELQKLEQQITAELRAATFEDAKTAAGKLAPDEAQRQHAELAARLGDLDERGKELFAEKSRASDRLNAVGGDDAVARIEAERKTTLLEMEDLATRFLKLRTGALVAEHAIRAYRDKHRSAMMTRASEAFKTITRGEYSGLATSVDKDKETLMGLTRLGRSEGAANMSKGTQFQLYLALRMAGYEEFAALRPPVPFIADDIMETFDEPRSEEVFRLLGQMAGVGQVIYLTHHRHLCDIAQQAVPEVKVHEIS